MLQQFSQTEIALRDTCVRYADAESFDKLAQMYGFPRPKNISVKAWRRALRVVLYGPRGTFMTLYAFLKEALSDYTYKAKAKGMPLNSGVNEFLLNGDYAPKSDEDPLIEWNSIRSVMRALLVQKTPGANFPSDFVGRTVVYTPPSGNAMTMVVHKAVKQGLILLFPIGESAYTDFPQDDNFDQVNYGTLDVLPFTLFEPGPGPLRSQRYFQARKQNVVLHGTDQEKALWVGKDIDKFANHHHTVIMHLHSELGDLFNQPETYWQEQNETKEEGYPYGGHMQEDEGEKGDPVTSGPHPPYFPSDDLYANQSLFSRALRKIMPDGCHVVAKFSDNNFGYSNSTVGKTPSNSNDPDKPLAGSLQAQ